MSAAGEKMKEAAKNNILRIDCQLAVIFYLKLLFLAFTAVSVKSEKTPSILIYKLGILKLGHYCNHWTNGDFRF
jgi:hypothetical protein